jgi:hypothetical protein
VKRFVNISLIMFGFYDILSEALGQAQVVYLVL